MSPEMANLAIEHGCAGIQVSNHGGRSLDDVPATITVLPHIAEAVRGRIPIVVDGGAFGADKTRSRPWRWGQPPSRSGGQSCIRWRWAGGWLFSKSSNS